MKIVPFSERGSPGDCRLYRRDDRSLCNPRVPSPLRDRGELVMAGTVYAEPNRW